jgi:predicted enzyme related to lactoylglutathione lyase
MANRPIEHSFIFESTTATFRIMATLLGHITLLVNDYDIAAGFYADKLGFIKESDNEMGGGFRWVSLRPNPQAETAIVLVHADTEEKRALVGRQVGDHILFVLETDDADRDYKTLQAQGVSFLSAPEDQPWGRGAILEDLYGNKLYLLQPAAGA